MLLLLPLLSATEIHIPEATAELDTTTYSQSYLAGDVDGDGIADVVAQQSNQLEILYGAAEWVWRSSLLTGDAPRDNFGAGLAISDLDGDGMGEILVGAPGAGSGAGAFYLVDQEQRVLTLAGSSPTSALGSLVAAMGDMDGDGVGELAVAAPGDQPDSSRAGGAVYVYARDGSLLWTWAVPGVQQLLVPGDVDGDEGDDLLALGSGGVSLLLSGGTELWREEAVLGIPDSLITPGDLNRDGLEDIGLVFDRLSIDFYAGGAGGPSTTMFNQDLTDYWMDPYLTLPGYGRLGDINADSVTERWTDTPSYNFSDDSVDHTRWIADGATGVRLLWVDEDPLGAGDFNGDGLADLLFSGYIRAGATDADGDGWAVGGLLGEAWDCNDSDASIYFFSEEVAGDGSDSDCDGVEDPATPESCPTFSTAAEALAVYQASTLFSEVYAVSVGIEAYFSAQNCPGQSVNWGHCTQQNDGVDLDYLVDGSTTWRGFAWPMGTGQDPLSGQGRWLSTSWRADAFGGCLQDLCYESYQSASMRYAGADGSFHEAELELWNSLTDHGTRELRSVGEVASRDGCASAYEVEECYDQTHQAPSFACPEITEILELDGVNVRVAQEFVHCGQSLSGQDGWLSGDLGEGVVDLQSWTLYPESDGDGWPSSFGDCDDTDPAIQPCATEIYYDGVDQNCDGKGDFDADEDGHDALVWGGDDCDDNDGRMYAGATEFCDGVDNNCDGVTDESSAADAPSWYIDGDGDGYGDHQSGLPSCSPLAGRVQVGEDCNDQDPGISPAALERCGGAAIDEDCDTFVDDADPSLDTSTAYAGYLDEDQDGYGTVAALSCTAARLAAQGGDCADQNAAINPGAVEICDFTDQDEDCNGWADDRDAGIDDAVRREALLDLDRDGYAGRRAGYLCDPLPEGDCNDQDPQISPGRAEICDSEDVDENCNGVADDADPSVDTRYYGDGYIDADGDGFGFGETGGSCDGTAVIGGDCDDTDPARNPSAPEICDAANTDENCNGVADDQDATVDLSTANRRVDGDGDGFGAMAPSCDGVRNAGDCNDRRPRWFPGAEDAPGDGRDQNCSGSGCSSGAPVSGLGALLVGVLSLGGRRRWR